MEFHIVHFEFDNQITAVNSLKVQCTGKALEPGEKCNVPFETENVTEDGRTEYKDVLYEGTVVCKSLVKKKAMELSKKGQEELNNGVPLSSIIDTFKNEGKKRDSAAKLAEAIKSLNSENPPKKSKPDTAGRTAGRKGAKQKKKAQSEDQPSVSATKRSKIHPEKLAEINELLKDSEEITATKTCNQLSSQTSSEEINILKQTTSSENFFKDHSTPKRQQTMSQVPRKSQQITQTSTDGLEPFPSAPASPSKLHATPKKLTRLETPRRSPRLQPTRNNPIATAQRYSSMLYEDVSPIKGYASQWDGTFVDSFNVLDWNVIDQQPAAFNKSASTVANISPGDLPEQETADIIARDLHVSQQSRVNSLCGLLGITKEEAATASRVFRRVADILGDESRSQSQGVMANETDHHESTIYSQPEQSSSVSEISPSMSKKMGMLIRDPSDPEKFKDVLVDKTKEREVLLMAKSSKKSRFALLNGLLECVFGRKELSASSGLGLRSQGKDARPPLNPTKLSAIKEYMRYQCAENKWQELTTLEFNTTVTNKVTNSRRILAKHPSLRVVKKVF